MRKCNVVSTLAVLCLLYSSHSVSAHQNSQFEQLKGRKRGDRAEGIPALREYLHGYGYLDDDHRKNPVEDRDRFDESTERAVKTYQRYFNLNPTGVLDDKTISLMMMPRCGMPDISIRGGIRMNAAGRSNAGSYSLNQAAVPVWPPNRRSLTWAVAPGTRKDAIDPLGKSSMEPWSDASGRNFTFRYNRENYNASDIKICFRTKATDPGLDGKGGIVAYAIPSTEGIIVFDEDETWAPGPAPGAFDIGRVGLHEMGHILGLPHSSDDTAIMFPYQSKANGLGKSDIAALKNLYGF